MEAVRRETAEQAPIPFPWTRAWPGFAAFAAALLAVGIGVTGAATGATSVRAGEWLLTSFDRVDAGWIAFATILALAPSPVCRRVMPGQ